MNSNYIILIIGIIFLFIFILIEPLLLKTKVQNKNEHGSSRFAKKKEIIKNFPADHLSNITTTGFPVYYSKNLKKVYFDKETPHYVFLGSTGSGKSVTSVIPSCIFIANSKEKRSVFITDPKGEIFSKTSKMFKKHNYNVLTIDFRNPEYSSKINLLEPIIIEYEKYIENENRYKNDNDITTLNKSVYHLAEANRLMSSLSSIIISDEGKSNDPFWNNTSKNFLEGLIAFFLEEYKLNKIERNKITLTSIRKFQNSIMDQRNFANFIMYIKKKEHGSKSKDSLTNIISASENTYKSITAVFGEKMNIFDDLNVANILCNSDFDFNELGKNQTVLYLIVPDEEKAYFKLVTAIVGMMYKELVKLANSNKEKKLLIPVDFILDEFANCPPLDDISAMVSVARSRGIRFYFYIQSFSQLNSVYGKDIAQTILDNCGLTFLKTNTQETAEEISKRLGKKTIQANSISNSLGTNNYNGNSSYSLVGRELLTSDEVMRLHYKTIIFPIKGHPIIRKTVLYNNLSIYIKGELERTIRPLSTLKESFVTIDDVFGNAKEKKIIDNDKEVEALYKDKIAFDKSMLKDMYNDLIKAFGVNQVDYRVIDNDKVCVELKLNRLITVLDDKKVRAIINEDLYKIENQQKFIRIYLKNINNIFNNNNNS